MKIRTGVFCFFWGVLYLFLPKMLYSEDKVHIVRKGETFYSIAREMGIKADDLMKYNGISDPSRLQAGQRLKIPESGGQSPSGQSAAKQTPVAGAAASNYQVIRGDTLFSIARKFSVTVASILEANSLQQGYVLREGDSLKLPGDAKVQAVTGTQAGTDTSPANSALQWPVTARELSYMTGKLSGVIITGTRTESVISLTPGTVLSAGPYRGFGKVVIVQVEGSYLYVYGGCESLSVKEGDKVGPGTELGKLGVDAVSVKPQLYFMVYKSNVPVDPAKAPRA